MIRKVYLLFLLSVCFIMTFAGNSNKYLMKYINSKNGLSNSAVLTIFQSEDGLMWFGTYDGLNCFDSKNIDVYRSKSPYNDDFTFKSNIINGICQADNNCLWVKTFLGVARFSMTDRKIEDIYNSTDNYSVYSNSKGNTWVVNEDELLYYNTYSKSFVSLGNVIPEREKLVSALVAENGDLWLIYSESTNVVSFRLNSFSSENVKDTLYEKTDVQLHNVPIKNVYLQSDMFSFIDDYENLYLYDIKSNSKIFIRNISDILDKYDEIVNIVSLDGDIIMAFNQSGIISLKSSNNYEVEEIDRSIRVFYMFKDRNSDIAWIGTDGHGVMMLMKNNSIAQTIKLADLSPFLKRQIRNISTDRHGGLWIGTKGDGLLYIPNYENVDSYKESVLILSKCKRQKLSEYIPWEHDTRIFSIKESRFHDGMWIGGTNSNLLYFYSFKTDKMIEVKGFDTRNKTVEIKGIYEESPNRLWISATMLGLVSLDVDFQQNEIVVKEQNEKRIIDERGVPLVVFYSVVSEGDSVLWLGDRGHGLVRYELKNDKYKVLSLQKYLERPVDDVMSICQYDYNKFYIGTSNGVVSIKYCSDTLENISYIGQEHGLSNDMIHGILSDKNGFLWMSTNQGLNKYNPMNGQIHTFYGNGIGITEFSDDAYYKCPYTGRLFFGGINGLLYLSDNTTVSHTPFQDVVLRDFWIGNERTLITNYEKDGRKGWKFDSETGYFRFKFIVPDYVGGENIEYSYILEGYDSDWSSFSKTNDVYYVNVPPGKYMFKVVYKRDINEHNEKALVIPLYITQKWYKTIYMYIIWAFVILALAFGIVWLFNKYKPYFESLSGKGKIIEAVNIVTVYDDIVCNGIHFTVENEEQKIFVEKFISVVESNLDNEELGIPFIASELNMSTRQFYRKYNETKTEYSPNEFVKICRLEKAADLLKNSDMPVQEIIINIGINSRSYFYKEFTKRFGVTPKEFRNRAEYIN